MGRKGGLGKGLDSLLNTTQRGHLEKQSYQAEYNGESGLKHAALHVALSRVIADPNQPRKQFNEDSINQLAQSIRLQGVIQPLIVQSQGNAYKLVAGERRLRAAQLAQVPTVPVIVRDDLDAQSALIIALVENLQREDLNILEEAEGFKHLMESHNLTHEQVAGAVGKSRSVISNAIRLLDLDSNVQTMVRTGLLKMGHVRPLLVLEKSMQHELAQKIYAQQWSVRRIEEAVGKMLETDNPLPNKRETVEEKAIEAITHTLRRNTALDIKIRMRSNGSGDLVIPFANADVLQGLVERYFHNKPGDKTNKK